MIKYFYYEQYTDSEGIQRTRNEEIISKKPYTNIDGFYTIYDDGDIVQYYIDVEKRIRVRGSLDEIDMMAYDKLLIQERNLKLETL